MQGAAGGVSRYMIDVISNLPDTKYSVGIVFNSKFEDQRFKIWRFRKTDIQFFEVPSLCREISLSKDVESINRIRSVICEFHPDIVHLQSSKAGFVGRVAAKLEHVKKIVYTPHAYAFLSPEFSNVKRSVYTLAEKILSRYFTDVTINCSHSEYEHAQEHKLDRSTKFRVIPNAVPSFHIPDIDYQRNRIGHPEKKLIVGNVARVTEQKNPQLFERIAQEMSTIDSTIQFVWIGPNTNHRHSNFVDYLGEMTETQSLIGGIDVYLSTSFFEGLSYSLLEAASVGIPVFATDVPGNDEFISNYHDAYGFELTDNVINIAKKLKSILYKYKNLPLHPSVDGFDDMITQTLRVYEGF
ncbi:glycosyltransferase [Lacticaseibacillus suibinensis]|uniref:glycosyltransferase n=1 Tax=Lacticaseibacillus suibinensis TaxID=2486011 RepID=UPI0023B29610|nr:glycosyltransferase [Lacticaseibacillus suibinensis]